VHFFGQQLMQYFNGLRRFLQLSIARLDKALAMSNNLYPATAEPLS